MHRSIYYVESSTWSIFVNFLRPIVEDVRPFCFLFPERRSMLYWKEIGFAVVVVYVGIGAAPPVISPSSCLRSLTSSTGPHVQNKFISP